MINPPNIENDFTLWRYMDLAKFVSLLQTKSLYFSSGQKLNKTDRFECRYGLEDYRYYLEKINELNLHNSPSDQVPFDYAIKLLNEMIMFFSQIVGINSWIISEHQSNAMWKIYSKSDGIAIKSRVSKLNRSLKESNLSRDILHKQVIYQDILNTNIIDDYDSLFQALVFYEKHSKGNLDYATNHSFKINLYKACLPISFNKTRPFSYEAEYRFITLLQFPNNILDPTIEGNPLTIDLNYVIDEIYIAPDAEKWFYNVVCNLMNTYMIDQSKLIDVKKMVPSAC